jgi:hypothetical protein
MSSKKDQIKIGRIEILNTNPDGKRFSERVNQIKRKILNFLMVR